MQQTPEPKPLPWERVAFERYPRYTWETTQDGFLEDLGLIAWMKSDSDAYDEAIDDADAAFDFSPWPIEERLLLADPDDFESLEDSIPALLKAAGYSVAEVETALSNAALPKKAKFFRALVTLAEQDAMKLQALWLGFVMGACAGTPDPADRGRAAGMSTGPKPRRGGAS